MTFFTPSLTLFLDEAHVTPRSCPLGSNAKVSDWELGSSMPAHGEGNGTPL